MAKEDKKLAGRHPGIEPVRAIVPQYIAHKGKAFADSYYRHAVLWHWRDIVGEAIGRHVQPMGIKKGTLYLYSPDSTWRNEIRLMQGQVVQQLNNYAGQALVKELCFCRKWERPEALTPEEYDGLKDALSARDDSWRRDIQKMPVSPAEERALEEQLPPADPEVRHLACRLRRQQLQRDKARLAHGWHRCRGCGQLVEPEMEYCLSCRQARQADTNRRIRQTLRDIPWASLAEVREYVPAAEGWQVEQQRQMLVQLWASRLDVRDTESLAAQELAMLYSGVSPEHMTPERRRRILYSLSRNMSWENVDRAPERRESLGLDDRSEQRRAAYLARRSARKYVRDE